MSSLARTAPASESLHGASPADSTTAATSSTGATNATTGHMFQTAPSTAVSASAAAYSADTASAGPDPTAMKVQHSLELAPPQTQDSNTYGYASSSDLNVQGKNTVFNGLNIEHFEMEELQKINNDGVALHPSTNMEINHILSEFPEGADTLDDRSKSSKTEEETETVHLQVSPNESLIKTKQQINTVDKQKDETIVDPQKIQAYAMLDFDSFTFYVQTMQILLGRMVEGDSLTDALDIHLGNQKAISRRHAKIFYNFGNQRFELSVLGRNGAFVDGNFVEKGVTVPLSDGTKIQIGETEFAFVLPNKEKEAVPVSVPPNDQIENLDSLVANFDEIKKDIQSDKLLISKDPHVLDMVLDPDVQKLRELEIEKEIGKVLAREHPEHQNGAHLENAINGELSQTNMKKKSTSNLKSGKSSDPSKDNDALQDPSKAESKAKTKPKRQPKAKKKVYTIDEIPEQYRTKPNLPYSILITDCLRQKGTEKGMSLSEIYKGIQELYPYYFYCPDGWQSSVRHNLSLNKSFRKISKEGKGWLWGINEEVVAEKDRARQKQLENAKAKGKSSSTSTSSPKSIQPSRQLQANLHIHNPTNVGSKNIVANDSNNKSTDSLQYANPSSQNINSSSSASFVHTSANNKTSEQPAVKAENTSNNTSNNNHSNMSANTKKALAYLQKELISLTKSRKMYDRATSTEILTKALAMTISQVDQAAKNFAIKGFPLVILIDKNPGHVTKILTAALNAATLQVCKQKGLTPHLPPKTPIPPASIPHNKVNANIDSSARADGSKGTPESTNKTIPKAEPGTTNEFSKSPNVPILHIKKEGTETRDPIFHKATPKTQSVQSPLVTNNSQFIDEASLSLTPISGTGTGVNGSTATENNNLLTSQHIDAATPPLQTVNKQATGPVVYQISKAGIKPSFKPAVKPISGASVKSFGPSHPAIHQTSIKPIKPVRLGGISGTGIIKPQFYAKGKVPATENIRNAAAEGISEEEEIKRSIAKFGRPTAKPAVAMNDSEKKADMEVKEEIPETEINPIASNQDSQKSTHYVIENSTLEPSVPSTDKQIETANKEVKEETKEASISEDKKITTLPSKKTKEDGEGDDELDDELHMMLADLEKDEDHDEPESKKRTIGEVREHAKGEGEAKNEMEVEGGDEKRVKTDSN
ncbi:hypothetical protein PMKS-001705 [Pichia membranifaciens]|uniref:Pre-rRNA-processing protein FHL1 n=1 Tax=Pichia membranifaciens TaxID=4926 RepID=A0A1Q2YFG8_9ASCO|nr:hypothetical protein PMKS-001705 [Pichia membranifaciens]